MHSPDTISPMRSKLEPAADTRGTRRQWLGAAAAGFVAATGIATQPTLGRLSSITSITPRKVIDTHQHLWDFDRFELLWTKGNEKLDRSLTMADYRQATAELPLEAAVYMEVGLQQKDQVREAEYVVELCRDSGNPTIAGVIAGQPHEPGFAEYVRRFAKFPELKGLRHLLIGDSPQGLCLQPEYTAGVRLLGEHQWRFDICIPPTELTDAAQLVKDCPDTRFILDHCGNADPAAFLPSRERWRDAQHAADEWKRGIDQLASQPNIVCKISGIIARADREDWKPELLAPIVNHCYQAFGPERLMFASDWPVCLIGGSLKRWYETLVTITTDWPIEEQKRLFAENAREFYELNDRKE